MKGISLKAARVNAGLTQAEAAKIMKISSVTLSKWESGKVTPSENDLTAMSVLYGVEKSLFLIESSV